MSRPGCEPQVPAGDWRAAVDQWTIGAQVRTSVLCLWKSALSQSCTNGTKCLEMFSVHLFHQGHACLWAVTFDDCSIHPVLHICTPPKPVRFLPGSFWAGVCCLPLHEGGLLVACSCVCFAMSITSVPMPMTGHSHLCLCSRWNLSCIRTMPCNLTWQGRPCPLSALEGYW